MTATASVKSSPSAKEPVGALGDQDKSLLSKGSHFTAEQFRQYLSAPKVGFNTQVRLVSHLPQGCPECWQALKEAGLTPSQGAPAEQPMLEALRLVQRGSRVGVPPTPKCLVRQLPQCPVAFAHLFFDQQDCYGLRAAQRPGPAKPVALPQLAVLTYAAVEGLDEKDAADLQGRYRLTLAREHHRKGRIDNALRKVDSATRKLEKGTGAPTLSALRYEVLSEVLWQKGERRQAIVELISALELLPGYELVEHRIEIFTELGKLLICTGNKESAAVVLGRTWELMTRNTKGLALELMDRLTYRLAVAERETEPPEEWQLSEQRVVAIDLLPKIIGLFESDLRGPKR
jgi:tetratricopeptide (TPR) repeat protein